MRSTPLLIIRIVHQLGPKPYCSLSSLAQTYSPIMSLQLGLVTIAMAFSPIVAQEILQKNDQSMVGDTLAWAFVEPWWHKCRHVYTFVTTQSNNSLNIFASKLGIENLLALETHTHLVMAKGFVVLTPDLVFPTLDLVFSTLDLP